MQRFIGLVIVPVIIAAFLLCGCSGESGPTLVFPFPIPTDLKVSGAIKLADVAVHGNLGGITPSLLDYRPFKLSVQDDSSISGESDEEGRFVLNPMSIRDQYVIFARNSKYKGFVLEYMAADSSGLYGEHKIEISIRSTAASFIARCLRDRYGRRINPSALTASHLDSTVKAIADVLESHPEKIASVALDQVAEVKAAYTAMAESLNNGQSGVVPNNLVLLLYMGGDNNLAGYINSNIADIEEAGLPGGTQVIIQADIAVHGMKRLLFYDGKLVELASVADVDSSSGAVVADFVAWSRRAFPASRYCLVISSHADGWKNGSSLRSSLISDQTSETKGNPIEIAAWVKGANTQFDGFYRPLDLLVFDACNMASLEIAREFKDTSSYMVFSQAFVPGSGFPYGQIMKKIQATGSSGMDGEKLGRLFCEAYKERYLDGALVTAVTVSLLKSSELPAFIGYLQNFFTQVQNNIGKLGPVLASLRDSKMVIAEGASETYVIQSFETSDYRDLHEMLSQCRNSMPEAAIEIDLIHQNFDRLILVNYFSSRDFPKAHGISIGLPDRSTWLSSYISPEKLFYAYYQFAQTTSWDEILAQITQN